MAKKKQEVKLKEPVRIRFKQLANGNQSIYLDYYPVLRLLLSIQMQELDVVNIPIIIGKIFVEINSS